MCKDDLACDYKPNHGAGPGVDFKDFLNVQINGNWQFCAGDAAGGDVGTLDGVGLSITYL